MIWQTIEEFDLALVDNKTNIQYEDNMIMGTNGVKHIIKQPVENIYKIKFVDGRDFVLPLQLFQTMLTKISLRNEI